MDSLSQIVLGAAVGEAVLGRKIGNRAMMWGAIAGTIPDLDVVSNLWLSEIEGLAAHRGISHSILFSVIGAVVLGYAVHALYGSKYHRQIAIVTRSILFLLISGGLIYLGAVSSPLVPSILAIAVLALGYRFIKRRYFTRPIDLPDASVKDWIVLFLLGLITHPILDCFTVYGTQLFAPFSNVRVAWSTISVADPLYTTPFLGCLITASFISRERKLRSIVNWAGIIWSCSYLLFTAVNKQHITNIFATSFAEQGIEYDKMLAAPTIFNNILWHGVAKTDSTIVFGKYSWFDSDKKVHLYTLPIGEDIIADYAEDNVIETLKWFSDGYYHVLERGDTIQFNDMRYGRFIDGVESPRNFIFNFPIQRTPNGLELLKAQGGPPEGEESKMFKPLWDRIRGIESDVLLY